MGRFTGFSNRLRIAGKAAVGIFSEQSMRQAYGMLSGVMPGGAGTPPTRGTAEYLRAYSQMPWLRAVTSRIATACAGADWQLYVVQGKGEPKARHAKAIQRAERKQRVRMLKDAARRQELRQLTDHPLLDLLHNANEFQTGFSMRKVTQLHIDLVGDAFWLKERDGLGTIIGVWPIPPHWILATPTPSFRFFRVGFRGWQGAIPDTEFLWFSEVDPLNPYGRGSGAAMALGDELDTDEFAARHTKSFFYNSARPDLIVYPKAPGQISPANIRRMEDDWMSQNQGFFRAFKPYFLTREVEVKELDQNFRSMTLVQLREFERDTIMQQYGVPPEILGVLENSNRATIDSADYLMARYVIDPRLEFQRTVMQERLVPEFDERLILEYLSPVQEDREHHLKVATVAPWSLTVDEWRKMSGHAPLEDEKAGSLFVFSGGEKPGPMEEPPPPPAPIIAPPSSGRPAPKPTPRRAMNLASDASVEAAMDAGDIILGEELYRFTKQADDDEELPAPSAAGARLEPALVRELIRVWQQHVARVNLDALERALGTTGVLGDVVTVLAVEELGSFQTAVLEPALDRAGRAGVDLGALAIERETASAAVKKPQGITIDLEAGYEAAEQWAREHAASLVRAEPAVRDVIRLMITDSIANGVEPLVLARAIRYVIALTPSQAQQVARFQLRLIREGVAADTISRRVQRYAEAQLRYRALSIARTELMSAINAGQEALWKQAVASGLLNAKLLVKTWIVTHDEHLEKICEGLDGQTADIGGLFPGGYARPPAHVRCRCSMGLVPKQEQKPEPVKVEVNVAPIPPAITELITSLASRPEASPPQPKRPQVMEYDAVTGRPIRVREE